MTPASDDQGTANPSWDPWADLSVDATRVAIAKSLAVGLVAVDVETAWLHGPPIEIAVIDVDGSIAFHSLINPATTIHRSASVVHGLRGEDVANSPEFVDIWEDLQRAIGDATILAYNAQYDHGVLQRAAQEARVDGAFLNSQRWLCAMRVRARLSGGSMVRLGGRHRAVDDARACLDLWRQMGCMLER